MTEIRQCNREGCKMMASRYPRVLVNPRGWQVLTLWAPLVMAIPLAICLLHQDEFDPHDFLDEASCARVQAELERLGKMPCDFNSARVEWARIGARDWCANQAGPGATVGTVH